MTEPEFPRARIEEFRDVRLVSPTIMAGFVGPGLVGPIAVSHMVSQMRFEEFGCMRSRHMPPATVFFRGRLQHPFRLYASPDASMCAAVCEITLRAEGIHDIITSVLDWGESRGAREIVILDGMSSDVHENRAYYAAETDMHDAASKANISLISRGYITGISGGILDECLLRKINGAVLLASADRDVADPVAAAALIDALNALYGTTVDAAPLRESAAELGSTYSALSKRFVKHRSEAAGMYM